MTIFKNAFLVAACSASTCFADCGLEPFALPFENAEVIADTAMNATPLLRLEECGRDPRRFQKRKN